MEKELERFIKYAKKEYGIDIRIRKEPDPDKRDTYEKLFKPEKQAKR